MSARKYHVSQTCLVGKCFFQCDPFDKFLTLLSWELSSNDTVPVRMILGGVLGGVSFLAIFVGLVFWYHRKRRHSRPVSTPSWHKAELPGVSVSINPSNPPEQARWILLVIGAEDWASVKKKQELSWARDYCLQSWVSIVSAPVRITWRELLLGDEDGTS